jgi:hypothetical protein
VVGIWGSTGVPPPLNYYACDILDTSPVEVRSDTIADEGFLVGATFTVGAHAYDNVDFVSSLTMLFSAGGSLNYGTGQ